MQQKEDLTESSFFYTAYTINTHSINLLELTRSRQHRPSFKKLERISLTNLLLVPSQLSRLAHLQCRRHQHHWI